MMSEIEMKENGYEVATLGAGCFWCVEAVFQRMEGVVEVVSGYTGGTTANPTYRDITTGQTGHAEVVRVVFNPEVVNFAAILDKFWMAHDPTTLNRQGADVGTQYRSAIFYHSEAQREIALQSKTNAQTAFDDPIVTEITSAPRFFVAEAYHQNYFNDNRSAPYCQFVIQPKLRKLGLN